MLSIFPQLFAYEQLAPLILRLAAGLIIISFSYSKIFKPAERKNFILGIAELFSGIMLIAGFLTQLAAGLVILMALFGGTQPKEENNLRARIILIAAMAALMLLGPGAFSIDLPL